MALIHQLALYIIIAVFTFLIGFEVWKSITQKLDEIKKVKGGDKQWQDTRTQSPYQTWKKKQRM